MKFDLFIGEVECNVMISTQTVEKKLMEFQVIIARYANSYFPAPKVEFEECCLLKSTSAESQILKL